MRAVQPAVGGRPHRGVVPRAHFARHGGRGRDEAAGVYVFAGGLEEDAPVHAVNPTGRDVLFTDGPYVETKEWLGAFAVVEVADDEPAKKWAGKMAQACGWPTRFAASRHSLGPSDLSASGQADSGPAVVAGAQSSGAIGAAQMTGEEPGRGVQLEPRDAGVPAEIGVQRLLLWSRRRRTGPAPAAGRSLRRPTAAGPAAEW